MQDAVLREEQPSLAVFSGDMVSGFSWDGHAGWYAQRWAQLTAPVRTAGVPFAAVLGNHDSEADLSRAQIMQLHDSTSNAIVPPPEARGPQGANAGASNYYLDIMDSDGQVVAARIWMLDSNNRGCGQLRAGW